MDAIELKAKLTARAQALQKQRAEMVTRHEAQLAVLDGQLLALRNLAQNWDTLTLDQAITVLTTTGLILEIHS